VDRFTDNMIAYPGRSFGQLYHRMLKHNQLITGKVDLSGHEIDVADITAPVLVFGGNADGIAPIESVRPLVTLLEKSSEVRFEIVPGGHLGMLTGRAARETTWVTMDEWVEQHSTPDARSRTRKKAAKKARKKPAPRAAKTASPVAPDRSAIGSNPERRFASASSRNLARKS
ncbi:MAG: alpha/beta hydrolase, partial [Marmoricola sp.]